ncbi:hypothetical protein KIW84_060620 [Lathyrus oleraceus]|uniref:Uncharacterized protein n=1 Tax=Pisum sativum TaxID=3888 RepID=A0A9D5A329_PEA|nr:hypothetical protein KIW84_060620 [Pisum sativum]
MPRAKIRVRVRGAHSGAKVIDAILPRKVRTTYNKRCRKVKEVGDLMTGKQATEAPVNDGRNYNGPKVEGKEGPLPGGLEPSVRYHSGRARILTLCQDRPRDSLRAHIDGKVWHLDVGSSPPGAVVGSKGWAVRPLKRYVSWVQNVVRQFGPYPVWALEHWEDLSLVREDREGRTSGVPVIVPTVNAG